MCPWSVDHVRSKGLKVCTAGPGAVAVVMLLLEAFEASTVLLADAQCEVCRQSATRWRRAGSGMQQPNEQATSFSAPGSSPT